MSSTSLYDDDWGWDDAPSQADLDEIAQARIQQAQDEGPDPFPDEEEFSYANKLKIRNDTKQSSKPGFLQIWEDETHTTSIPVNSNTPPVAKRSNGYKPAIGSVVNSVAKTPIVPSSNTNPYSAEYVNPYSQTKPPVPSIPGMVKASQMVQPTQAQQPSQPQYQPAQYQQPVQQQYITAVPLISDYELGRKIIESTYVPEGGNIPTREPILGSTQVIPRPRQKVTRQLFLTINSMLLSNTIDLDKLKKHIDRMVLSVTPRSEAEAEICLYNADEVLRQMVIQIVGTREDPERLIILNGAKRILDMYLNPQVLQKEFIKAQNATYPHPAYVGIQASLDTLNYIYIWTGNVESTGRGKTSITRAIGQYLTKYRGRLNPLPADVGLGKGKTVFYYDIGG